MSEVKEINIGALMNNMTALQKGSIPGGHQESVRAAVARGLKKIDPKDLEEGGRFFEHHSAMTKVAAQLSGGSFEIRDELIRLGVIEPKKINVGSQLEKLDDKEIPEIAARLTRIENVVEDKQKIYVQAWIRAVEKSKFGERLLVIDLTQTLTGADFRLVRNHLLKKFYAESLVVQILNATDEEKERYKTQAGKQRRPSKLSVYAIQKIKAPSSDEQELTAADEDLAE